MTTGASTPIADAIRAYLDAGGWHYDVRQQDGITRFSAGVTLPNGAFRTDFDADDRQQCFRVLVYARVQIPETRRGAVAEYLTRVNATHALGKIDMDPDTGEIRSVTAATLAGGPLSLAMIDRFENTTHLQLNDAYPGIMMIAFGDLSPQTAFDAFQRHRQGESSWIQSPVIRA